MDDIYLYHNDTIEDNSLTKSLVADADTGLQLLFKIRKHQFFYLGSNNVTSLMEGLAVPVQKGSLDFFFLFFFGSS